MIAWSEGGPKETAQKVSWWWPTMENETQARIVTRRAAWCAIWTACVDAALSTMGMVMGAAFAGFDQWTYLDAGIAGVLAVGLWRYWRAAAVLMTSYQMLNFGYMVWSWVQPEPAVRSAVTIPFAAVLFLVAYVNSVRSTFAMKRFRRFVDNT